jgi:hypothetical protein
MASEKMDIIEEFLKKLGGTRYKLVKTLRDLNIEVSNPTSLKYSRDGKKMISLEVLAGIIETWESQGNDVKKLTDIIKKEFLKKK